ncbi:MAG: hypothetical protein HZC36_09655 [Armatimonadetes bacterium]|nr:hypothetical protein [Armatimonadota bacterium]
MSRKALFAILVGGISASALANGAMSLALSFFSWPYWLAYVAATLIFEAIAMGRWLRCTWKKSALASVFANVATGIFGGCVSGIVGYEFLGTVGSTVNPDPLGQAILMLATFGLGSAFVEALFWQSVLSKRGSRHPYLPILGRSFVVHLVGVPLALCILLIPDHPYPGLESQVAWHRGTVRRGFSYDLVEGLATYMAERDRLPKATSFDEMLRLVKPDVESVWPMAQRAWQGPERWVLGYLPDYARFDRTEMKRRPILWNTALSGKPLAEITAPVWLIKWSYRTGWTEALVLKGDGSSEPVRVWGETPEEFERKMTAKDFGCS